MKITRRKFVAGVLGGVVMLVGRISLASPVRHVDYQANVLDYGEYVFVDGWLLKKSDVAGIGRKG